MDCLAASTTHVYGFASADTAEHNIDATHSPDGPRNASALVNNVGVGASDVQETTCTVTGVDATDNPITEHITVPVTSNGGNNG